MDSNKNSIYIISIVGVVAIVGMFLIVLNQSSISNSVDNVGQASSVVNTCTDSDSGTNYNVKGTTRYTTSAYGTRTYIDTCTSAFGLREYFCNGAVFKSTDIECSYSCISGRCLSSSEVTCNDTDKGRKPQTYGTAYFKVKSSAYGATAFNDTCQNSIYLTEYWCNSNSPTKANFSCSGSCYQGACINSLAPSCSDTDGGVNAAVKGDITLVGDHEFYNYADVCLDTKKLDEQYCKNNDVWTQTITCNNSCAYGVCQP